MRILAHEKKIAILAAKQPKTVLVMVDDKWGKPAYVEELSRMGNIINVRFPKDKLATLERTIGVLQVQISK